MNTSVAVGLDLGKASTKFVTATNQGEIPAWLAKGCVAQVIGTTNGTGEIRYKGQEYICGRNAVLGSGFSWSATEDKDEERNLVLALSSLASQHIYEADIVTGVPVVTAGSPAAVNRVKALLSGRHEVGIDGETKVIDISVSVMAEPLGSYFSLILTPEGRMIGSSPYLSELLGIIDIGFRTVDIVVMDGSRLATTRDSTLSGITILYDQVFKLMESDFGKMRPNEVAKLNTWLIGGCQEQLTIAGKYVKQNLVIEISRLKAELARRVMAEVENLLSAVRPDKLILTGGGAAMLKDSLLQIKQDLTFHPNPRMGNAIGFYRAAVGKNGYGYASH